MARKSREAEEIETTRDDESRDDMWSPPSLLEAPPARPGFVQRWVSTQILGKDVPQHTLKRFREGWTPRLADTVPEDYLVPTIEHGKFDNVIGVEGAILCEMPESRVKARRRYFADKVDRMNAFVDENLNKVEKNGDSPIYRTNKTGVSHGQRIANDED